LRGWREIDPVAGKIVTGSLQYKLKMKGLFPYEQTRAVGSFEEAEPILGAWR